MMRIYLVNKYFSWNLFWKGWFLISWYIFDLFLLWLVWVNIKIFYNVEKGWKKMLILLIEIDLKVNCFMGYDYDLWGDIVKEIFNFVFIL